MSHGCSGGSGTVGLSTGFDCNSGDGDIKVLCLESCNLGCSDTGCAQTDIAQNQIVILRFSEEVDPNTVSAASIRFRTAAGDEPVGEFFVNGSIVEFVPTLAISGGQTFFGFTAGETYTMTIVGGDNAPSVVRGTSGKAFGETLTCTLASTRGIVDLNGVPPSATLISPSGQQLNAAPLNTEILLEFNELIDATPFLTGTQSPVEFAVRRTRPDGSGGFECNPDSDPLSLAGTQALSFDAARGVSLLSFTPTQALPGNVCIEINVTDGVRDLSGKPAQPQVLVFRTVVVPLVEEEIVENFDDDLQLDRDASAGTWGEVVGGEGVAKFAKIGGDGLHGPFSLDLTTDTGIIVNGRRIYELDCDSTLIPAENTLTSGAITVTNGRFFFTRMVVPSNVHLRFVGTNAPILTVAGRLDIQGTVEVNGESVLAEHQPALTTGQAGGVGGIFGGDGGRGGDKANGNVPATAINNGGDGQNVRVRGGHGYLPMIAGTGGKGSLIWPASGLTSEQQFGSNPPTGLQYCLSLNAGGGGGGLWTAGGDGTQVNILSGVTPIPNASTYYGPVSAGGTAMQLFPFPPATGLERSVQHFLVGGAGGGGSASSCMLSLSLARTWSSGAGGGGGGGAMALRCGGSLFIGPAAIVEAKGGSCASYSGQAAGAQVAPAGGGSGGSIIIQAGGAVQIDGAIDVSGGLGGTFDRRGGTGVQPQGATLQIQAGNGSPGFVRYERQTLPQLSELASLTPAATADNIGAFRTADFDDLVGVRSLWYSTGLIFGPEFSHYVIEANIGGQDMTFSDDPSISPMEAKGNAPLRAMFQAANLDIQTGQVIDSREWRDGVRSSQTQNGIATDGLNGYRFMLLVNRMGLTDPSFDVIVKKLTVVYRN